MELKIEKIEKVTRVEVIDEMEEVMLIGMRIMLYKSQCKMMEEL